MLNNSCLFSAPWYSLWTIHTFVVFLLKHKIMDLCCTLNCKCVGHPQYKISSWIRKFRHLLTRRNRRAGSGWRWKAKPSPASMPRHSKLKAVPHGDTSTVLLNSAWSRRQVPVLRPNMRLFDFPSKLSQAYPDTKRDSLSGLSRYIMCLQAIRTIMRTFCPDRGGVNRNQEKFGQPSVHGGKSALEL